MAAEVGTDDSRTTRDFILLGGNFELGGKFGSCWSEVILVIFKVKIRTMTS